MTTALLIDGNSHAHRALAVGGELHDALRRPTGMAYFFLQTLQSALTETRARECWVAWDGGRSWRCGEYPAYKAKRKPRDAAYTLLFDEQREYLLTVLVLLGVGVVVAPHYEADDVLALLARVPRWSRVWLCSGDRDYWQLVDERIGCLIPNRGGIGWRAVTVDTLVTHTKGIMHAHLWLMYRALSGDASDNLPGVAGIGDKKARAIVNRIMAGEIAHPHDALTPAQREQFDGAWRLMSLHRAANRLHADWSVARYVVPQSDLAAARMAIHGRQMASIVADWPKWSLPFVALRPAPVYARPSR